ncbi:hypothetical protein Tco_1326290 [Tanacetum coccineum]
MSNLKKCLSDESLVILLEELRIDDKLHFVEEPAEVMDREIKQLKRSRIPIIKVIWNSNDQTAINETPMIEGIQGVRLEEAWEALKGLESSSTGYK